MISCPNDGPSGHAFCQVLGCEFCMIVIVATHTRYECDGMREASRNGGGVSDGNGVRNMTAGDAVTTRRPRITAE